MRSSCPNCLSQMEHSHSEQQVVCSSCGERYSPFLSGSHKEAASQEPILTDFTESALAFKDIIDFGQGIEPVSERERETKPVGSTSPPAATRSEPRKEDNLSDFFWTTGDLGTGYRVQHWLPPLSRMVILGEDPNPLEKAFHILKEESQQQGANAVIGIRCSLSPDNKRALIIGIPVRCEKNQ